MIASPENSAEPATPSRKASVVRLPERALGERHQRQDAALALVVRLHEKQHVFRRHDDQQGPDDQRDDADDLIRRRARTLNWPSAVCSA